AAMRANPGSVGHASRPRLRPDPLPVQARIPRKPASALNGNVSAGLAARSIGMAFALCPAVLPAPAPVWLFPLGPARLVVRNSVRVRAVANSPELEAERALCERASSGDRDALGALLKAHGPRLYRSVLLPRLGSPALAEEALSQTYMKVVERFAQFSWQ